MEPWDKRPFEYRRLFNPAFCAVLILRAIKEFEAVSGKSMPFSLSFLILPLSLHENSRNIFKANTSSNFLKVLSNNPEILIGFAKRASYLVPYTLEGLGYAFNSGLVKVFKDGSLQIVRHGVKTKITGTTEVQECQKVAVYLGRVFARNGSKITIFTSLGVRP